MPRKRPQVNQIPTRLVPNQDPNQNPNPPLENPVLSGSANVEVDQPAPTEGPLAGLLARAQAAASVGPEASQDEPEAPRGKKIAKPKPTDDLATLLSSLLAVIFLSLAIPSELRPLDDERDALAYYSTRILLRHFPITKKLNADALDIIGLLSVLANYYARVSPYLASHKDDKGGNGNGGKGPGPSSPVPPAPISDIAQFSPETDQWLKMVQNAHGNNGNQ